MASAVISPPLGSCSLAETISFGSATLVPVPLLLYCQLSDICVNAAYCLTGDIAFILIVAELHKFSYLFEMF
jgi:hypothetical protein